MVKTFKHGHSGEGTNLTLVDHPFPRRLGVDDEFIPNLMFDLGLVPLFMVENMSIAFDPNGPKHDATKEMPNFDLLAKFLRNPLPKQGLLLV